MKLNLTVIKMYYIKDVLYDKIYFKISGVAKSLNLFF